MQGRRFKTYQKVTERLQGLEDISIQLAYYPKNSDKFVKTAQGNQMVHLL